MTLQTHTQRQRGCKDARFRYWESFINSEGAEQAGLCRRVRGDGLRLLVLRSDGSETACVTSSSSPLSLLGLPTSCHSPTMLILWEYQYNINEKVLTPLPCFHLLTFSLYIIFHLSSNWVRHPPLLPRRSFKVEECTVKLMITEKVKQAELGVVDMNIL